MSQELIYTSAPRGLKVGSRGFCTVASTPGMAKNLAERLEALSGYRHVFPPQDPQAALNPVAWSCLALQLGPLRYWVLSRVADAGLDYSQRTNKLAHHLVLAQGELPAAGPAATLAQPGVMETRWTGEPRLLTSGRPLPKGDAPPSVCHAWQQTAGDAGWAGVLAQTLIDGPREACLIFRPGQDLLPLIREAQALLPAALRWQATFSTYYTKLPAGAECAWRCVVDGTPEATAARRAAHALVLDLTRPLGAAPQTTATTAARQGQLLTLPAPRSATPDAAPDAATPESTAAGRSSGDYGLAPPALVQPPDRGFPPPRTGEPIRFHRPKRRRRGMLLAALVGLLAGMAGVWAWRQYGTAAPVVATAPKAAAASPGKAKPKKVAEKSVETEAARPVPSVPEQKDRGAGGGTATPQGRDMDGDNNSSSRDSGDADQRQNSTTETGGEGGSESTEPRKKKHAEAQEDKKEPKKEPLPKQEPAAKDPFADLPLVIVMKETGTGSGLGSEPTDDSIILHADPKSVELELIRLFATAPGDELKLKNESDATQRTWNVMWNATSIGSVSLTSNTPKERPASAKLSFEWKLPKGEGEGLKKKIAAFGLLIRVGKEKVACRWITDKPLATKNRLTLSQRHQDGRLILPGLPKVNSPFGYDLQILSASYPNPNQWNKKLSREMVLLDSGPIDNTGNYHRLLCRCRLSLDHTQSSIGYDLRVVGFTHEHTRSLEYGEKSIADWLEQNRGTSSDRLQRVTNAEQRRGDLSGEVDDMTQQLEKAHDKNKKQIEQQLEDAKKKLRSAEHELAKVQFDKAVDDFSRALQKQDVTLSVRIVLVDPQKRFPPVPVLDFTRDTHSETLTTRN